jgi:hypothetical protein
MSGDELEPARRSLPRFLLTTIELLEGGENSGDSGAPASEPVEERAECSSCAARRRAPAERRRSSRFTTRPPPPRQSRRRFRPRFRAVARVSGATTPRRTGAAVREGIALVAAAVARSGNKGWSVYEPSGRNRCKCWQMGRPGKPLKYAELVAVGCDRLPRKRHSKEGVRSRALQNPAKRGLAE